MNAGNIYEVVIGTVMIVAGATFVCIDFGLPPGSEKIRKVGDAMPMKKDHPLLFSLLGPMALVIGLAQILRQFHLLQ